LLVFAARKVDLRLGNAIETLGFVIALLVAAAGFGHGGRLAAIVHHLACLSGKGFACNAPTAQVVPAASFECQFPAALVAQGLFAICHGGQTCTAAHAVQRGGVLRQLGVHQKHIGKTVDDERCTVGGLVVAGLSCVGAHLVERPRKPFAACRTHGRNLLVVIHGKLASVGEGLGLQACRECEDGSIAARVAGLYVFPVCHEVCCHGAAAPAGAERINGGSRAHMEALVVGIVVVCADAEEQTILVGQVELVGPCRLILEVDGKNHLLVAFLVAGTCFNHIGYEVVILGGVLV